MKEYVRLKLALPDDANPSSEPELLPKLTLQDNANPSSEPELLADVRSSVARLS